jgi:hypothetical protein
VAHPRRRGAGAAVAPRLAAEAARPAGAYPARLVVRRRRRRGARPLLERPKPARRGRRRARRRSDRDRRRHRPERRDGRRPGVVGAGPVDPGRRRRDPDAGRVAHRLHGEADRADGARGPRERRFGRRGAARRDGVEGVAERRRRERPRDARRGRRPGRRRRRAVHRRRRRADVPRRPVVRACGRGGSLPLHGRLPRLARRPDSRRRHAERPQARQAAHPRPPPRPAGRRRDRRGRRARTAVVCAARAGRRLDERRPDDGGRLGRLARAAAVADGAVPDR